jgi:hypothetical protein
MSNVAELRTEVASLKQADATQEMTIALVGQKVDSLEKAFEKHETADKERHTELMGAVKEQWDFTKKLMLGLGGGMVSIILALLGLIGARPDLIKSAMAGAAP